MDSHDKVNGKGKKSFRMRELKWFQAFWRKNVLILIKDFSLTTKRKDLTLF
jgi:hypothetical protein